MVGNGYSDANNFLVSSSLNHVMALSTIILNPIDNSNISRVGTPNPNHGLNPNHLPNDVNLKLENHYFIIL